MKVIFILLHQRAAVMHVVFPALHTYTIPFDAFNVGDPMNYRVHIWYGNTRVAGLQSGDGHMTIDSIVWAQHINVTDTQTATWSQQ